MRFIRWIKPLSPGDEFFVIYWIDLKGQQYSEGFKFGSCLAPPVKAAITQHLHLTSLPSGQNFQVHRHFQPMNFPGKQCIIQVNFSSIERYGRGAHIATGNPDSFMLILSL